MPCRVGVVTFPGSLDDRDAQRAIRYAGAQPVPLWHGEDQLHNVDAVVLPGGFSYGDYLRAGALAAITAPVMRAVITAARRGVPVLGICNGFQVLCEAGLLPGALIRNGSLHFVCRDQRLQVVNTKTCWTAGYPDGAEIVVPVKNGEGRYVADPATVRRLEEDGRVVFRYVGPDPGGSMRAIAGVADASGRVVGVMPHPEHAVDPLTGPGTDGLPVFTGLLASLAAA